MGRFGELYQNEPERALNLAEECGWLMATEVLAVGIDFSFAPVLDLNDISDVIGDRAFAQQPADIIALADAFYVECKRAGMASDRQALSWTWFRLKQTLTLQPPSIHVLLPKFSHRICKPLSNCKINWMPSCLRMSFMIKSIQTLQVFLEFWLQQVLRQDMGYDGVLFSDDLSMQAACVAGDADARIHAALLAGCDMGLVCNNRAAQRLALNAIADLPLPRIRHV